MADEKGIPVGSTGTLIALLGREMEILQAAAAHEHAPSAASATSKSPPATSPSAAELVPARYHIASCSRKHHADVSLADRSRPSRFTVSFHSLHTSATSSRPRRDSATCPSPRRKPSLAHATKKDSLLPRAGRKCAAGIEPCSLHALWGLSRDVGAIFTPRNFTCVDSIQCDASKPMLQSYIADQDDEPPHVQVFSRTSFHQHNLHCKPSSGRRSFPSVDIVDLKCSYQHFALMPSMLQGLGISRLKTPTTFGRLSSS